MAAKSAKTLSYYLALSIAAIVFTTLAVLGMGVLVDLVFSPLLDFAFRLFVNLGR